MFIEDIDLGAFDAPFFHISPSDAASMDPQQRQLLEVVYECLENGGITMEGIDGDGDRLLCRELMLPVRLPPRLALVHGQDQRSTIES